MTNYLSTTPSDAEPVLTRRAVTGDAHRISDLARLDDKRHPAGPFLVAEVSGEIVAAVSLSTGAVVADPFRLTGDTVALLRLRAAQVGNVNELTTRRALPQRSFDGPTAVAA
jgi:hypothetical protein